MTTNPPFGKKSSITILNEEGDADRQALTYNRPDFWTTTSNKQLNFVQHLRSLLAIHGRAAVVSAPPIGLASATDTKVARSAQRLA